MKSIQCRVELLFKMSAVRSKYPPPPILFHYVTSLIIHKKCLISLVPQPCLADLLRPVLTLPHMGPTQLLESYNAHPASASLCRPQSKPLYL
jgi:hypothetical protein